MAKRKVWKTTTGSRYAGKIHQLLISRMPPEEARAAALEASTEYARGFGPYMNMYREMVRIFGDRIPPGLRGLYRSALFAMYKAVINGYNVEYIIEKFERHCGLDRALLEDIARRFGLLEASAEAQS